MDTRPSLGVLRDEIKEIEHLRDEVESEINDVFLAGVLRGLEWAAGRGMAPTELMTAMDRMGNRVH